MANQNSQSSLYRTTPPPFPESKAVTSEAKKVVLARCTFCLGGTLYVSLNADKTKVRLGCCNCESKVELAVNLICEFSVSCWEDFRQKNEMYGKLTPLYQQWNKANSLQ